MSKMSVFKTAKRLYFVFAALLLAAAGCGLRDPFFVPVSFIDGVPETGTAGTPLTLTANVRPGFASNRDITWLVADAGTTEASISGNVLYTAASGTAVIKAKIANGIAEGKDFTQDFKIVFSEGPAVITPITSVALTVTPPAKNGIPNTAAAGSGHYTIGDVSWSPADNPFKGETVYTATVTLTAHEGYTFTDGITAAINGNSASISANTGTTVTISYTFAATLDKEITGITIKTQPVKLTYTEGDALDLSGLVVTLVFDTGSPVDVAFSNFDSYNISANPAHGTALTLAHNGTPITVIADDHHSANTGNLTVNAGTAAVTGVTLTPPALTLIVGDTASLTATVAPSNAANKAVTWSTSAPAVATVSGGLVTAVSAGEAVITVTTADGGFTAECAVTVTATAVRVTGVSLDKTTLNLTVGDTAKLNATVTPFNATNQNVTWSSGETGVASVTDDGVVTALAADTVTITVTTEDGGFTATCTVTVNAVRVTGVSLDKTTLNLTVGDTAKLNATVTPFNATNQNVIWSSDETGVASVTGDGLVTALAADTVTITVTTEDGGFTAACAVTVSAATVPVTGVSLNKNTLTLTVGSNETLTAAVEPADATNKNVTWGSGNTAVATVDSGGKVTAVGVGSAEITVTTVDGSNKTAMCTITVRGVLEIEMVPIPAGTFMMGSPTSESGRNSNETQHSVTLSAFSISKYQVTQKQYQAVMGSLPSSLTSGTNYGRGDNYPVYYVSWYDALVFCNKLSMAEGLSPAYRINSSTNPEDWGSIPTSSNATWNAATIVEGSNGYRLPTEAQWEYACRAGTTTAYNTGDTISDNTGWYNGNSGSATHEVGLKSANAWGLYDMHGNVYEWCWDWYGGYSSGAQTDPAGASSGTIRVFRGGSWDNSAGDLRSASRDSYYPVSRSGSDGFRLVRPGE